jgi:hypothetical protein
MPRRRETTHFAVVCGKEELRKHLTVCENSGFRLAREVGPVRLSVFDRETVVLHATKLAGGFLLHLHRAYYHHPLGPPSEGEAPPGVP